jgi:7 transmembrane receptor (rhodopsin family)
MSAWITVAITFERTLAVSVPMRVATLSTPCRARLLLATMCVVCSVVTAYPLWTVGLSNSATNKADCRIVEYDPYIKWLISTFIIGSMVLPAVLLIILTSVIFFNLTRSKRLHRLVRSSVINLSSRERHKPNSIQFTLSLFHLISTDAVWRR